LRNAYGGDEEMKKLLILFIIPILLTIACGPKAGTMEYAIKNPKDVPFTTQVLTDAMVVNPGIHDKIFMTWKDNTLDCPLQEQIIVSLNSGDPDSFRKGDIVTVIGKQSAIYKEEGKPSSGVVFWVIRADRIDVTGTAGGK